ncbi:hypothetical protein N9933_02810 [bacterium]|nr:hypothetical protein [bacterium]
MTLLLGTLLIFPLSQKSHAYSIDIQASSFSISSCNASFDIEYDFSTYVMPFIAGPCSTGGGCSVTMDYDIVFREGITILYTYSGTWYSVCWDYTSNPLPSGYETVTITDLKQKLNVPSANRTVTATVILKGFNITKPASGGPHV